MHARLLRRGLLLVLVTTAVACGGDGGDVDDAAEPATTTTAAPAYPASVEAVPSAGCGSSDVGVLARERRTLDVAGEERWYLLSTPPAHDGATPLPLVVEFHGLAQGAEGAAATGLLDELGAQEGFVAAFPHGTGAPVRWNQDIGDPANADLAFVDALLDTLSSELCIDEARVYAQGMSYGAIMSSAMACARPDRFAAIGPVAGIEHPDGCRPGRPIPVMALHGTADPILFFNGGVGDIGAALAGGALAPPDEPADLDGPGYPAAVAAWADANGCGPGSDDRRSPTVVERSYDCDPEAEVRFLVIEGGGHTWPGSDALAGVERIVGASTDELEATTELWQFFRRHANPHAATSGTG